LGALLIYQGAKCWPNLGMDYHEIRRQNLEILIREAGSQSELAERVGTDSSYLSTVKNKRMTQGGTPRGLGDEMARRMEEAMDKPPYWMDQPHDPGAGEEAGAYALGEAEQLQGWSTVPIVGTAQLGDCGYWYELEYPKGHGDGHLNVPSRAPEAYALRVRGDSMAPAIRDGWYVVVEPNTDPSPGEYVLVQTTDGRSMVKELLWQRNDQVALMSVNESHGRLTLAAEEIRKMEFIGLVASPSKKMV
jgi:phage repressor protein C with HTH and peptisase S24 domain